MAYATNYVAYRIKDKNKSRFSYLFIIYLFTNENDTFRRIYSKFSHANFQARVQLAASFTLKNLLFVSDSSSCKMKYKPIRSSTYN